MSREIDGRDGRLNVDDGGSGGTPVVFIHAFAGSASHWAEQLGHLRGTHRAVAFDLPGHGASDPLPGPDPTIEGLAEDVGSVLDGLDLDRAILVGHSIGGLVAIAYAGAQRERVAGLLLVGTPGRVPIQEADRILSAMTSDYEATMAGYWDRLLADATPDVAARIRGDMDRMPSEVAMGLIRATFTYDPLPALRAYPGPTMTVTIGDSPYDLHRQVPDVPDAHFVGTSHWVQMDRPVDFDRILDGFIARVDASESRRTRRPARSAVVRTL